MSEFKIHDTDQDTERALEEETLTADAAELISQLLEDQDLERQELASRLGKSKAHVTQLLSGRRNMTLRTLAGVAFSLGRRMELSVAPLTAPRKYPMIAGPAIVQSPQPMDHAVSPKTRCAAAQSARGSLPSNRSSSGAGGQGTELAPAGAADENHSFALSA